MAITSFSYDPPSHSWHEAANLRGVMGDRVPRIQSWPEGQSRSCRWHSGCGDLGRGGLEISG